MKYPLITTELIQKGKTDEQVSCTYYWLSNHKVGMLEGENR